MAVVVLLVGGVSFYGGTKYQQSKTPSRSGDVAFGGAGQFRGGAGGGNGGGAGFAGARGGAGGGMVNGDILSKDDKSVTVKLRDGGSKIVFFSLTTRIGKTTDGIVSDLEVGKQITVTGATNSDGSVTAQMIQIRALMPQNATSTGATTTTKK